jgi:hypothetical protein
MHVWILNHPETGASGVCVIGGYVLITWDGAKSVLLKALALKCEVIRGGAASSGRRPPTYEEVLAERFSTLVVIYWVSGEKRQRG